MATTIAQVRTLVNDPAGASQIFDDPHYQTIIDIEDNVYRAAATAALTLAAYFAQKVEVTAGPVKIKNEQKYEHYSDLATDYNQRAREGGGTGSGSGVGAPLITGTSKSAIDSLNSDPDRVGSIFSVGMDNNDTSL